MKHPADPTLENRTTSLDSTKGKSLSRSSLVVWKNSPEPLLPNLQSRLPHEIRGVHMTMGRNFCATRQSLTIGLTLRTCTSNDYETGHLPPPPLSIPTTHSTKYTKYAKRLDKTLTRSTMHLLHPCRIRGRDHCRIMSLRRSRLQSRRVRMKSILER